ncbi:hypothetical protein E8E14_007522 [Neopestalotiopsis sp. 37M]|nr:hypothetical protein E8E14_007522 [Neopestalotiopsis sp. 37M]
MFSIDVYESDTAHTWAERFFAAGAVGVSASAGVAVPDALLPTDYDQSAKLLVSTLKSMDGLREFSFSYKNLKEDFPAEFSNLVRDWKLCLPRLTGLRLVREEPDSPLEYPLSYALASMCPNLERAELEFDDIFGTRQVPGLSGLGDLPRLLEIFFTAGGNELTNANVRTIVETFPQLRRLGIDRTLGTGSPESLVPILSSLPDLEFLAITDDLGTHDPVTDENRHMSKEDRRLLRQKRFAENLFIQCRVDGPKERNPCDTIVLDPVA